MSIFKKFIKYALITILSLFILIIVLLLFGEVTNQYKYNHKYSIAMPKITGNFNINNNYVEIWGLNNIVDESIATLTYSEIFCTITENHCDENRITISGWGDNIMLVPASEKYEIKYADKNKIILNNGNNLYGEIDLNLKTLYFTVKNAGIDGKTIRKIEIITDNQKIEKLEKKIIRKYLKREWFK